MRTTFVNELINEARNNHNLELLTGDLGFGVLKDFIESFSGQYTNCGIAEQNMLSVAGGMASLGKTVVVYSIGNFPTIRALEQIRNDICYYNHNVKIICIGGGYTYGSLGMSHHATEDVAVLRAMPNMTIFTPSDKIEAMLCCRKMFEIKGPCYLRLERDSLKSFHDVNSIMDVFNPQQVLNFHSKYAIFTYGTIIEEVYDLSKKIGIDLFTFPCLKPIEQKKIASVVSLYKKVFIVEEHSIIGGLGDIISDIIASSNSATKTIKIGIRDTFLSNVGNQQYMRKCAGIDSKSIESLIVAELDIAE